MPYREDTCKKETEWALWTRGSVFLAPDEDGPAIMAMTTLGADKHNGTYKNPK
jgi:hypothetical protein